MRNRTSTRRTFLQGGALLAGPMAAASVSAAAQSASGDSESKAQLERLKDEVAIRELHRSWLGAVNAGRGSVLLEASVRRITPDHSGAVEKIEIAADGRSALGTFDCEVERQAALPQDCTLGQMAHAQGHGLVLRSERQRLIIGYSKARGAWSVREVALHPR